MPPSFPRLAVQLRVMRYRAGLTLAELSAASGVGMKLISRFECDPARTETIKLATLDALCRACGTDRCEVFRIAPTHSERIQLGLERYDAPNPKRQYVMDRYVAGRHV